MNNILRQTDDLTVGDVIAYISTNHNYPEIAKIVGIFPFGELRVQDLISGVIGRVRTSRIIKLKNADGTYTF